MLCISQLDWILEELLLTAMKAILQGELSSIREVTEVGTRALSSPVGPQPLPYA